MNNKIYKSQLCNVKAYEMYKRQLLSLAENVFEFENMPDYIDMSYINGKLLRDGAVAFFVDEVMRTNCTTIYNSR